LGNGVGDQLLKIAGARLEKSLRSCDIIGRPGGDEFVALVPDVDSEVADKLAKRLTEALEKPYKVGRQDVRRPAAMEQLAVLGTQIGADTLPVVAGQAPAPISQRGPAGRPSRRLCHCHPRHRGPHHAR